jgi:hypothetical protein
MDGEGTDAGVDVHQARETWLARRVAWAGGVNDRRAFH